jgi:hypothetical protein
MIVRDYVAVYLEGLSYDAMVVDNHIKVTISVMDNFFKKKHPFEEESYNLSEKTFIALYSAHRIASNLLLTVGGAIGTEVAGVKRAKADVVETEFFGDSVDRAFEKIKSKLQSIKSELEVAANRLNLIVSFNEMNDIVVQKHFQNVSTSNIYLT